MPEVQETNAETQVEAAAETQQPLPKADASAEEAAQAEAVAKAKAIDEQVAAAMEGRPTSHEPVHVPEPEVSLASIASQGREALLDAMRRHSENKPPPYVPPAMTERQLSRREEEMEAGRRAVARAQAQQATRPVPTEDRVKEGFTTPVYRPDNAVPDPTIPAVNGVVAGVVRG
jgi:hypothetical protein